MNNKDKLARSNKIWVVVGSLFFAAITTLLLLSLISTHHSEIVISTPKTETVQSLSCESHTFVYPFFKYDNSIQKTLEITVAFDGDQMHSIFLQYILYYDDAEAIDMSEGENHAAMNTSFYEKGLKTDAANATYSRLSDSLKMGIYETAAEMTEAEKGFFLLDGVSENDIATLNQHYNRLGLDCEISK